MSLVFNDISFQKSFYPFSNTRPVSEVLMGLFTFGERLQMLSSEDVRGLMAEISNDDPSNSAVKLFFGNGKNTFDVKLESPWDVIRHNGAAIRADFELIKEHYTSEKLSGTNNIIGEDNIFVSRNVKAEFATFNASDGPIYIGEDVEIMEGSLIRGPVAMCKGAVIKLGSKIYGGTTIGPYCVGGGEIKNSILTAYSNKSHEGYLGDSMIGAWCNLGAGTSNSNLKNTAGVVRVWNEGLGKYVDNGNKCGLLMGDYSRCAINTSFNTGTVVGTCCNIFGHGFPYKHVSDFTWGSEKYHLHKAFADIENWKQLKGHHLTDQEKLSLTKIYSNKP